MQVQHPRATPVDGRNPPSKVSIPGHGNVAVGEDGYLSDLDEAAAQRAMTALADSYGIEYTEGGDVVVEDAKPDDAVPFDPGEFTNDELAEKLSEGDYSDAELDAVAAAERDGRGRTGALDHITAAQED